MEWLTPAWRSGFQAGVFFKRVRTPQLCSARTSKEPARPFRQWFPSIYRGSDGRRVSDWLTSVRSSSKWRERSFQRPTQVMREGLQCAMQREVTHSLALSNKESRAALHLPQAFPPVPAGSARVTCESAPKENCTEIKLLCRRLAEVCLVPFEPGWGYSPGLPRTPPPARA